MKMFYDLDHKQAKRELSMSDKKRKRTDDGGARPSKKLSSEAPEPAATVKFSVVKDVGDYWAPVIGELQSSVLRSNPTSYIDGDFMLSIETLLTAFSHSTRTRPSNKCSPQSLQESPDSVHTPDIRSRKNRNLGNRAIAILWCAPQA